MLAREKATGTQAVWSDTDNGGRGGWVIPGLSEKMGGPVGAKAGQQQNTQDDPDLAAVAKLAENEQWADAYTAINKLDKSKYANDPGYQKLYQLVKGKAGL